MNTLNVQLLLASKSPRRQYLLKEAGYNFEVVSIDVEEDFPADLKRAEVAAYLAEKKAKGYTADFNGKVLVTADTIVCVDDEVINKPADAAEAAAMLKKLSGRVHTVITGVCLRTELKTKVFTEETKVYFKPLTDEEINHYITTCQPFDKAGAYGIQEWIGYIGVEKIEGDYYNVMGFPLARFYKEINGFLLSS